jgi:hypothetical protein
MDTDQGSPLVVLVILILLVIRSVKFDHDQEYDHEHEETIPPCNSREEGLGLASIRVHSRFKSLNETHPWPTKHTKMIAASCAPSALHAVIGLELEPKRIRLNGRM